MKGKDFFVRKVRSSDGTDSGSKILTLDSEICQNLDIRVGDYVQVTLKKIDGSEQERPEDE